jgi:exodeoxyribonuclease I
LLVTDTDIARSPGSVNQREVVIAAFRKLANMTQPIVWYDTETTGKEPRYDQPIQFGAIRTDADLNMLDEFEIRCRPQSCVLPAPEALLVHGVGINEIMSAPMSFYAGMRALKAQMDSWGAGAYAAYNSIHFDEEVVRHSLYRTLHDPYATQKNGNCRFDGLRLMHATHILQPGILSVPFGGTGKPSFKLEALASANGFEGHKAHDALGDVHAMIHMARLVRQKAPEIWKLMDQWMSKTAIQGLLTTGKVVVEVAWYGGICLYPMVPVVPNADVPTEWALVDLKFDPRLLLEMSPDELCDVLTSKKRKPFKRLKTNGMPILLPGDHPLATRLIAADRQTFEERARLVSSDHGFPARVQEALRLYRASFEKSDHVEDQLYERFFPTKSDHALVDSFHAAPPSRKMAVVESMKDPRARTLGRRIVFDEWPEVLGQELPQIRQGLTDRLNRGNVPWMTVPNALGEIARLRVTAIGEAVRILKEYQAYLADLAGTAAIAAE